MTSLLDTEGLIEIASDIRLENVNFKNNIFMSDPVR